jgi:hypothetical protein
VRKHTPGPWRLSYDRGYYIETAAEGPEQVVCNVSAEADRVP